MKTELIPLLVYVRITHDGTAADRRDAIKMAKEVVSDSRYVGRAEPTSTRALIEPYSFVISRPTLA